MTFQEFLDGTLFPALMNVAVVFVTVLTGMAIAAIRKWGENQKAEFVRNILAEAADAAERSVAFTTQVFTEGARGEDGKLSLRSAQDALSVALKATREQLGAEGLAMLARAVGGDDKVSNVLRTFVEAAVSKQKAERESSDAFLAR
jgi:hypothetical protein